MSGPVAGLFVLASTSGPADHVMLDCAAGHWLGMASDMLPEPTR